MTWDMKVYIDHPIRDLAHAESSYMAKLLFFFLARIWVIWMTMKPSFEKVGGFFGKFSPLTLLRTVDECWIRDWLRWTGRRRSNCNRGRGRRHGGRVRRVTRGDTKLIVWERPVSLYPAVMLTRDTSWAGKHVCLGHGGTIGSMSHTVVVFDCQWRQVARSRTGSIDLCRNVPIIAFIIGGDPWAIIRRSHRRGKGRRRKWSGRSGPIGDTWVGIGREIREIIEIGR